MLKIIDIFMLFSLLCLSILMYSLSDQKIKTRSKNNFFFVLLVCLLVSVYSFRDLGLDLEAYRHMFNDASIFSNYSETQLSRPMELGWVILIFLLKKMGLGFNFFLFFSSLIPFGIIIFISLKEKLNKDIWLVILSFYLLFLFSSLDAIRAFFASSLILLAIYFYSSNRKLLFFIFASISVLFHSSAVIVFVFPLLMKINWKISIWFFTCLVLLISSMLFRYELATISFLDLDIERNTSLITTIYWKMAYYLLYYNSQGYTYINGSHEILSYLINFTSILAFTFISLCLFHIRDQNAFIQNAKNIYLGAFLLYCVLNVLGAEVLAFRILVISNLAIIFVIPYLLKTKFIGINLFLKFGMIYSLFLHLFLVLLYQAGLHQPQSLFFIGF
ncbi:EpsG family protein [Shewanella frigidimarina]|uniref:EpsG family protein n=1 Tax=Shewanella frigidimarina TaxID=56812 RepID=UPI003D7B3E64